jgi:hypothetical protein
MKFSNVEMKTVESNKKLYRFRLKFESALSKAWVVTREFIERKDEIIVTFCSDFVLALINQGIEPLLEAVENR